MPFDKVEVNEDAQIPDRTNRGNQMSFDVQRISWQLVLSLVDATQSTSDLHELS